MNRMVTATQTVTRTALTADETSGYVLMLNSATTHELLDHLEVSVAHRNALADRHEDFSRANQYVGLVRMMIVARTEV